MPIFPLTGLTPEELAGRREDWAEIEDCYPLSPMQEGMLFHTLMSPGSGIYLMQQFYAWEGRLDRGGLRPSLATRHRPAPDAPHLFHVEGSAGALQVVHRRAAAEDVIQDLDWADMSDEQQQIRMGEMLEQELKEGLGFEQAPLMRIRLVRRGLDRYAIVRSFHHILTDDWCFSLLMMDFLTHYDACVQGQIPDLPDPARIETTSPGCNVRTRLRRNNSGNKSWPVSLRRPRWGSNGSTPIPLQAGPKWATSSWSYHRRCPSGCEPWLSSIT